MNKTQNRIRYADLTYTPGPLTPLLTICREGKEQTELQTQPEGKGMAGDSLARTEMEEAPGSSQIPIQWARLESR